MTKSEITQIRIALASLTNRQQEVIERKVRADSRTLPASFIEKILFGTDFDVFKSKSKVYYEPLLIAKAMIGKLNEVKEVEIE